MFNKKEIEKWPLIDGFYTQPVDVNPTRVHKTATIRDRAIIGSGASIGYGVIIENRASIGDGAIIGSGVIIENRAIIGSGARIWSGARRGGKSRTPAEKRKIYFD